MVRGYLGNRRAVLGSGILLVVLVLAAFPALFLAHDPADSELVRRLLAPAWQTGDLRYPLGADALGRDLWSRVVAGARISVTIGVENLRPRSSRCFIASAASRCAGVW